MPKDRLADLQQQAGMDEDDDGFESNHFDEPLSTEMAQFFEQIETSRAAIDEITEDIDNVKRKQSEILSNPVNDAKTKTELDELMAHIKKEASAIRAQLKRIQTNIEDDEENPEANSSAEFRIRKAQHSTMMRKFVDVMTEYNKESVQENNFEDLGFNSKRKIHSDRKVKTQTDFREACKNRIDRQLKIAGQDLADEELEAAIESGNLGSVTSGIFTNTEQAKQSLQDIEARHNDIMKLETSIRELHDMFMDMAMLVESQGEMIDRIEFNVDHAGEYVHRATGDVRKAGAYQRAARRKKLMMIACAIIAVIVLLGVAYGMFMP